MARLVVAHTADLDAALLAAARTLLFASFADMTNEDWEHALGGVHAIVLADGRSGYRNGTDVIGHASVIARQLHTGGRSLRCGYVEAVAVAAGRRRQGLATQMMAALERVIDVAYDLGALGSTEEAVPFYTGRGWQCWRGPLFVHTPDGSKRTPDEEGWVYVRPGLARIDLDAELACGWRAGDVW